MTNHPLCTYNIHNSCFLQSVLILGAWLNNTFLKSNHIFKYQGTNTKSPISKMCITLYYKIQSKYPDFSFSNIFKTTKPVLNRFQDWGAWLQCLNINFKKFGKSAKKYENEEYSHVRIKMTESRWPKFVKMTVKMTIPLFKRSMPIV